MFRMWRSVGVQGSFALCVLINAWSCSGSDFVEGRVDTAGAGGEGAADGGSGGLNDGGSDGGIASEGGAKLNGGAPFNEGGGAGVENVGALSVLSTTPAADAIAVSREGTVEVIFSAPIDKPSITALSFQVEGPLGVVEGKLAVAGDKVTFTPNRDLSLLADYVVTLSSDIHSTSGDALARYELDFQTRDGAFAKPKRVTTVRGVNLSIQGNQQGHVAAVWNDYLAVPSIEAAVFDPSLATWGASAPVEADTKNGYSSACLGLNERGRAFVVIGDAAAAWNRFDGFGWGAASTQGVAERRSCALADDGSAMTTWTDSGGNAAASLLDSNNTWSDTTKLRTAASNFEVARFGDGFLAFFEVSAENAIYSRVYQPSNGWLPAAQVTAKDSNPNYWSVATGKATAMFTWQDASGSAKAAIFDGDSWSSKVLGPGGYGTHARVGMRGHLAAWFSQGNAYLARYDLQSGWEDPIKLGTSDGEVLGPGAEVDPAGNMLAAWGDGGNIVWRRRARGVAEWSAPQQIKDQDPAGLVLSTVDDFGNVMLVWENALGIWASRFE